MEVEEVATNDLGGVDTCGLGILFVHILRAQEIDARWRECAVGQGQETQRDWVSRQRGSGCTPSARPRPQSACAASLQRARAERARVDLPCSQTIELRTRRRGQMASGEAGDKAGGHFDARAFWRGDW
eukprot:4825925-Pleurochrysis_carterae.AAC.1